MNNPNKEWRETLRVLCSKRHNCDCEDCTYFPEEMWFQDMEYFITQEIAQAKKESYQEGHTKWLDEMEKTRSRWRYEGAREFVEKLDIRDVESDSEAAVAYGALQVRLRTLLKEEE